MKLELYGKVREFFQDICGGDRIGKLDFGILRTLMLLASVDGDISAQEMDFFREMAGQVRGGEGAPFEDLWKSALHGAGYLLLQKRLLPKEALVAEFVREAEGDFVAEVAQEVSSERTRAFKCLEEMAKADNDYSEVERACVEALTKRVKEKRDELIAARYPRAVIPGK